ncbi:hypothetical protein K438DRAFT_1787669 [Mycena galopus ATCC 62051]|nr:hypothetical protein K438DRAFT_1787669 [Mycena galopus ATCC 62051]
MSKGEALLHVSTLSLSVKWYRADRLMTVRAHPPDIGLGPGIFSTIESVESVVASLRSFSGEQAMEFLDTGIPLYKFSYNDTSLPGQINVMENTRSLVVHADAGISRVPRFAVGDMVIVSAEFICHFTGGGGCDCANRNDMWGQPVHQSTRFLFGINRISGSNWEFGAGTAFLDAFRVQGLLLGLSAGSRYPTAIKTSLEFHGNQSCISICAPKTRPEFNGTANDAVIEEKPWTMHVRPIYKIYDLYHKQEYYPCLRHGETAHNANSEFAHTADSELARTRRIPSGAALPLAKACGARRLRGNKLVTYHAFITPLICGCDKNIARAFVTERRHTIRVCPHTADSELARTRRIPSGAVGTNS